MVRHGLWQNNTLVLWRWRLIRSIAMIGENNGMVSYSYRSVICKYKKASKTLDRVLWSLSSNSFSIQRSKKVKGGEIFLLSELPHNSSSVRRIDVSILDFELSRAFFTFFLKILHYHKPKSKNPKSKTSVRRRTAKYQSFFEFSYVPTSIVCNHS